MSNPDQQTQETLDQLDQLINDLKAKVSGLRDGEFDAESLEARLREVTELASKAASTLDSVAR